MWNCNFFFFFYKPHLLYICILCCYCSNRIRCWVVFFCIWQERKREWKKKKKPPPFRSRQRFRNDYTRPAGEECVGVVVCAFSYPAPDYAFFFFKFFMRTHAFRRGANLHRSGVLILRISRVRILNLPHARTIKHYRRTPGKLYIYFFFFFVCVYPVYYNFHYRFLFCPPRLHGRSSEAYRCITGVRDELKTSRVSVKSL